MENENGDSSNDTGFVHCDVKLYCIVLSSLFWGGVCFVFFWGEGLVMK